MTLSSRVTLAAILLLAAFARFYALDSLITGVYDDEALNGTEGFYAISTGQPRLFYPENGGREGLFINLVGTGIKLFGANTVGIRFWSAVIGTLAVLFIFCLGREWFSERAGLMAAFLLATSYWHVNFSRISFRAILVPTLMLGAFFGIARAWNPESKRPALWAALGGLFLGLGAHSYISFRIVPVIVLVFLALEYFRHRWLPVRLCAIWLGVAGAVALPMAVYFFKYPHDFWKRTNQVANFSTLSEPWKFLGSNFLKSLGMFHIEGDCIPRHNLVAFGDCQPEMNLFAGLLLLVGIGWAISTLIVGRRSSHFTAGGTLLFWFLVMLLPAALTNENGNHALRGIGALPAAMLLAAWGADRLANRVPYVLAHLALYAVMAISGIAELGRYFDEFPMSAGVPSEFAYPAAAIARYSNSLPPEVPRFVIADPGPSVPLSPAAPERRLSIALQPIVFFTIGHTQPTYLTVEEISKTKLVAGSILLPLGNPSRFDRTLSDLGVLFDQTQERGVKVTRILGPTAAELPSEPHPSSSPPSAP